MSKQQKKIELFRKYIGSNRIVGRVIDVNYKKKIAHFWVQEPAILKRELSSARHKPNIFYFHNLKDLSYSPQQGDLITADFTIPNNTLLFYNISKKNNSVKTKRISTMQVG